jgi:hypothetical protein
MGAHSNIKVDMAAIVKRRIYPPNTSLKRDFDCFANFVSPCGTKAAQ